MHEDRILVIKSNLSSLSFARESWISFDGEEKFNIDSGSEILFKIF